MPGLIEVELDKYSMVVALITAQGGQTGADHI